jgi:hypothetical protein
MTLGCGGWGGNITSDNISPRHLLNIKRLAYEIRPAVIPSTVGAGFSRPEGRLKAAPTVAERALPGSPFRPVQEGIPAEALAARIDQFLASRGFADSPAIHGERATAPHRAGVRGGDPTPGSQGGSDKVRPIGDTAAIPDAPADFVCEDDVREAMRVGRKLLIGEKTILTPSARDLGESQKVFVQASWPR